MAKNNKRHQKKKARKAAKRKAKKRKQRSSSGSRPWGAAPPRAAKWPLLECQLSDDWRNYELLTHVVVARQSETGEVATAFIRVDLGCLGVMHGAIYLFGSASEYRSEIAAAVEEYDSLLPCDFNLAAKVVSEGMSYARSLGLPPESGCRKALRFLDGASPEDCSEYVPLGGEDGKPVYVSSPSDDIPKIRAILDRSVGREGYSYVPLGEIGNS